MTEDIPQTVWALGRSVKEISERTEFTRQYVNAHAERAVPEPFPRMVYN